METSKFKVRITFTTPVLGTQPQKDVASEYLASKFAENSGELPDDEQETLTEVVEKGTTVFHKNEEGVPLLYDYQFKGFLKEAGKIFNGLNGVKALRSKIENLVFISPRQIPLHIPEGSKIEYLERPLRAETAQGPRIALARSEMLESGTWFEIEIEVYKGAVDRDMIVELMTYGEKKGIGQWRGGSYGRYTFQIID